MAASWNAGMVPVATVITDSSDHIRIAVRPIRVAVRDVIRPSLRAWAEAIHVRSIANPDCSVAISARNDDHKSHHVLAAIDGQRRAGNGAGLVGGQKDHRARDL